MRLTNKLPRGGRDTFAIGGEERASDALSAPETKRRKLALHAFRVWFEHEFSEAEWAAQRGAGMSRV